MKFILLMLGIYISLNPVAAVAQEVYTISQLAELATENSPKIMMLQNQSTVAKLGVSVKSNLPDPKIALGLANLPVNSFSFNQEPMTGKFISVSQGIPYPGKLQSIGKQLSYDDKIITSEINEERNAIHKMIKNTAAEYLLKHKVIEITRSKRKLLENVSEIVMTRYSVGKASQQNILSLELELSNLDDKLEIQNSELLTSLKTLQNYIYSTDEFTISDKIFDSIDTSIINSNYDYLRKLAENNRPLFEKLRLNEKKSEESVNVAEFNYYPDFNLTLQYTQRDKLASGMENLNDFLTFSVGFNLPINYGGNKTAAVESAKSMVTYQQNNYELELQNFRIQIEVILTKMHTLTKRDLLVSKKLIQADQTFNSSLNDYQVGIIDFVNVIDALNKLLDIETEKYTIRKNYYQAIAELSYLVGSEL